MAYLDRTGEHGGLLVTGTGANSGDFFAITMLTDTIFSTLTWSHTLPSGSITDFTFPKGVTIYGRITAFTLNDASYEVLAYKNASNE